jgi:hypothetical protein
MGAPDNCCFIDLASVRKCLPEAARAQISECFIIFCTHIMRSTRSGEPEHRTQCANFLLASAGNKCDVGMLGRHTVPPLISKAFVHMFGKANMTATRLVGVWAILSILWATFYVAVFALAGQHVEFVQVVSDILTPIAALLIIGGTVTKIVKGFRIGRF